MSFFSLQMNRLLEESKTLKATYPDAGSHIVQKETTLLRTYKTLCDKIEVQEKALARTQILFNISSTYREWMEWISNMISRITAHDLASNYKDGLYLVDKHREAFSMITSRDSDQEKFEEELSETSERLGSKELAMKLTSLRERKNVLMKCWSNRAELYDHHLDYLQWKKDILDVEAWLNKNEKNTGLSDLGENIEQIEYLIDEHEELETAMLLENDRVDKICRLTLIESKLKELRDKEKEELERERERLQREANEVFKRKETIRATKEKKRAEERRRTQEIVLPKDL